MENTIFDLYSKDEIDANLEEIKELLNDKYSDKDILEELDCDMKEEFLSIAKAQIRNEKDKIKSVDASYFNLDDLRFSTPKIIAKYRAERLKCNKIVDLCSGIGIQANSFSYSCKEVLAIEIDKKKVRYSEENFKKKNLRFICYDVLDEEAIKKVKEFRPDIIFCDPERLAEEKERNIDSIKPDIKRLIETYSKICPNICLETPPRIEYDKIKDLGIFEADYLNLNFRLNRLDLLFGKLKEFDKKVIDVISGLYIYSDGSVKEVKKTRQLGHYIYEVSEAVVKAGLINEIAKWVDNSLLLEGSEKNKVILTNKQPSVEFSGLVEPYHVIAVSKNLSEVNRILKNKGFGKAVIKYSLDPKDYWKERNILEKGLSGNNESVIFKINKEYVIVEEA